MKWCLRPRDRRDLFHEVARVLSVGGRFVCTSHNPEVRLESVDGTWHEMGSFPRSEGGEVSLALRGRYDEATRTVVGEQRLTVTEATGGTATVTLDLRFGLAPLDEIAARAREEGLQLRSVFGDYERGSYDPTSSPVIVAVFEKPRPS